MNYLFVIVIASLIPMVDNKLIKKLSRYFLNLSLILVVADTVYRLGNPMSILLGFASLFEGSTEFYIFKENSILFGDSNSSAFLVGTLLLFVYYSPNVKHKRIYFIALVTVLLLTFSRAAYIGYAAVALAWTLDKILPTSEKIGEKLVFVISFGLLLLFAFFPDLFRNITILSNDGSFQMKIYALHNLNILYQNSDLFSKIFGIGFGNAWLLKGFWPHNLISTYLIESGVTGLFLHFTFTFIILLKTRFRFLGYHIFLFLCGISFVPLGIPYFYVSLLILDRLRKISKAN
jgi:hypothetical protein